jgi:hypothetical protein
MLRGEECLALLFGDSNPSLPLAGRGVVSVFPITEAPFSRSAQMICVVEIRL